MVVRGGSLLLWLLPFTLLLASTDRTAWAQEDEAEVPSPLSKFDADGRLPQSDRAAKSVGKGLPVVAVAGSEGLVMLAPCCPRSPLVEATATPKMWRLTPRICLSHAGISQDSHKLLLLGQESALLHRDIYGEEVDVADVVEVISQELQQATQTHGSRPYGSAFLIAGVMDGNHDHQPCPVIYRADPSGTYTTWRACVMGQDSDRIMAVLEKAYQEGQDMASCLNIAIKACRAFRGDTTTMDIAVVTKAGVRMGERVPVSDLKSFLAMPASRRRPGVVAMAESMLSGHKKNKGGKARSSRDPAEQAGTLSDKVNDIQTTFEKVVNTLDSTLCKQQKPTRSAVDDLGQLVLQFNKQVDALATLLDDKS